MFKCSLMAAAIGVSCAIGSPLQAGVYSSIDTREETRFDRNYEVFGKVLDVLGTIAVPKPATNPPIRQRYILIETLASNGQIKLETLEQKVSYSAVLIRRGRAFEAARLLLPLCDEVENRRNFLLFSQCAIAHFLTGNPDFEGSSLRYMKKALDKWPKSWADSSEEQKRFLVSMGWDDFDFDRNRRCEEHLQRLMAHRLDEKQRRAKNPAVEETVDPIFVDAKGQPIRFRNEKGKYEAGKIAAADKELLRKDFVEDVMQLLIWMPNDERLLWLLAECLNASAMDENKDGRGRPEDKHRAVDNANKILIRLMDFKAPAQYGKNEIRSHQEVLQAYVDANPIGGFIPPPVEDLDDVRMTKLEWWRTLAVAGFIGLAIGMFATWQIQEFRRRRQARSGL